MKENIFEGSKFGDRFLTRNNRVARFISFTELEYVCLYVEGERMPRCYNTNGIELLNHDEELEIVSRKEIDEKELDDIAKRVQQYDIDGNYALYKAPGGNYTSEDLDIVFKAGFREGRSYNSGEWISVKDGLPEKDELVLCKDDEYSDLYETGYYIRTNHESDGDVHIFQNTDDYYLCVTHWMRIPKITE